MGVAWQAVMCAVLGLSDEYYQGDEINLRSTVSPPARTCETWHCIQRPHLRAQSGQESQCQAERQAAETARAAEAGRHFRLTMHLLLPPPLWRRYITVYGSLSNILPSLLHHNYMLVYLLLVSQCQP